MWISCLELYKKAYRRKLQKSKALRREVQQASEAKTNSSNAEGKDTKTPQPPVDKAADINVTT